MCKLVVSVDFKPEYYNRIARATIPENWTAEVVNGLPKSHKDIRIYADGWTKQEAIDNVINELHRFNLHGKLKIV